jgi:hypothetical protein
MKSSQAQLAGVSLLLLTIALCGCGNKSHDVVGNWIPKQKVVGIESSLELKSDGTWSQSIGDSKTVASASGTYTSDKDSLNMTETQTAVGDTVKKSAKNWSYTYKITWVNDDEMQLTPNDAGKIFGTVVYMRKK